MGEHTCPECRCEERRRKRGDYWLTAEGREELRESFDDREDGNAVRPLLDALDACEAALAAVEAKAAELETACARKDDLLDGCDSRLDSVNTRVPDGLDEEVGKR